MRQGIGAKQSLIPAFFTTRKPEVLPKGSNFNQLYLINCSFPDLKKATLNFRRRMSQLIFDYT
jgi:hypothetical protein